MALDPLLQDAVRRLFITDVTLKRIDARLENDYFPQQQEEDGYVFKLSKPTCRYIRTATHADPEIPARKVVFEMFVSLRVLRADADELADPAKHEQLVCATVDCDFYVHFDERVESSPLSIDALSQYGARNVPFALWPYWREIVQSACSRMGMPRIVMPTQQMVDLVNRFEDSKTGQNEMNDSQDLVRSQPLQQ